MQSGSVSRIFEALIRNDVKFIVVGGIAAGLQGSAAMTTDVDIVHLRTPENIKRLLLALQELDARYRSKPELRPSASHLSSPGHQLLSTSCGPLDILGAIEGDRDYYVLLPESEEFTVRGRAIRVLKIDLLLALKEQSSHPKDRNAAMFLRKALENRHLSERKPESK